LFDLLASQAGRADPVLAKVAADVAVSGGRSGARARRERGEKQGRGERETGGFGRETRVAIWMMR